MSKPTRENYTILYPSLMRRYSDMLRRCYDKSHHLYKYYGAKGVTVCEEWLNDETGFKTYVDWILYQKTEEEMKGLQVDKDILSEQMGINPAIYSPQTCCILTAAQNAQSRRLLKSNNTTGYKGISPAKAGKWQACCVLDGKYTYLGIWDTKLEAAKAYDYFNILVKSYSTLNNVLDEEETVVGITINGYENMHNTSPHYGVSYDKDRNKWAAQVYFNKKRVSLGRFLTELEAALAVRDFCLLNNHNTHKLKDINV